MSKRYGVGDACSACGFEAESICHHDTELRAEVRDLKARLKAVRSVTRYHEHGDNILEPHERVIKYATNIRMKNWRKP